MLYERMKHFIFHKKLHLNTCELTQRRVNTRTIARVDASVNYDRHLGVISTWSAGLENSMGGEKVLPLPGFGAESAGDKNAVHAF